jgi:hypothetical protein
MQRTRIAHSLDRMNTIKLKWVEGSPSTLQGRHKVLKMLSTSQRLATISIYKLNLKTRHYSTGCTNYMCRTRQVGTVGHVRHPLPFMLQRSSLMPRQHSTRVHHSRTSIRCALSPVSPRRGALWDPPDAPPASSQHSAEGSSVDDVAMRQTLLRWRRASDSHIRRANQTQRLNTWRKPYPRPTPGNRHVQRSQYRSRQQNVRGSPAVFGASLASIWHSLNPPSCCRHCRLLFSKKFASDAIENSHLIFS